MSASELSGISLATFDLRLKPPCLGQISLLDGIDELGVLLTRVAHDCDLHFERIQARRQRTRWGSCSVSGTISLNACALFLDPRVVRYLLVHELCHTKHMNHSKRFWALVQSHEPDYKHLDRALVRGWQSVPGWVFG